MLLRKILFGLSAFVLGISGAVSAQQKDASLLFHYRFDRDRNVELKGNAGLVDGVLRLDGKSGYAVVPDSRGMHFTERGMTLVGVVKFNDSGTKGGENDAHDIIMAKGREFIFGRNSKTMYINFHDGKNWVGTTMGGTPAAGVWTHFAGGCRLSSEHFRQWRAGGAQAFPDGESEAGGCACGNRKGIRRGTVVFPR